jgi:CheY-like chemotaxis protein
MVRVGRRLTRSCASRLNSNPTCERMTEPTHALFLDDSASFLEFLEDQAWPDLLSHVEFVRTVPEALAAFNSSQPKRIVVDSLLEGESNPDGIALLEQFRSANPKVELILLSSRPVSSTDARRLEAIEAVSISKADVNGELMENLLSGTAFTNVLNSSSKNPDVVGVRRQLEAFTRSQIRAAPRYSAFISYGGPDETFARKLHARLVQLGVKTFLFALHAKPGEKLHRVMREGINRYDRVILVCSKRSLDRPGVLNEIEETLQRESRSGGISVLIPITLDDYVFHAWAPERSDVAQAVRDRVVADFRGTEEDEDLFEQAMVRLAYALE